MAYRKSFNCVFIPVKICHGKVEYRIQSAAGPDMVLETLREIPDEIPVERPCSLRAVPNRCLSGELAHELVVPYILESELVSCVVPGTERLDIDELASVDLVMHIIGTERVLMLDVGSLELKPVDIRTRNDP